MYGSFIIQSIALIPDSDIPDSHIPNWGFQFLEKAYSMFCTVRLFAYTGFLAYRTQNLSPNQSDITAIDCINFLKNKSSRSFNQSIKSGVVGTNDMGVELVLVVRVEGAQIAFPRVGLRMQTLVQQIQGLIQKNQPAIDALAVVFPALLVQAISIFIQATATIGSVQRRRIRSWKFGCFCTNLRNMANYSQLLLYRTRI